MKFSRSVAKQRYGFVCHVLLFICSFFWNPFQWLNLLSGVGGKELERFTIPYYGYCSRAVETVQCTRRCNRILIHILGLFSALVVLYWSCIIASFKQDYLILWSWWQQAWVCHQKVVWRTANMARMIVHLMLAKLHLKCVTLLSVSPWKMPFSDCHFFLSERSSSKSLCYYDVFSRLLTISSII